MPSRDEYDTLCGSWALALRAERKSPQTLKAYGDEVIYWFPYDMIYDGDTGAIEYIPAD